MFRFNKKTLKEYEIADFIIKEKDYKDHIIHKLIKDFKRKDFLMCNFCHKYKAGYTELKKDNEGFMVKAGACTKCTIMILRKPLFDPNNITPESMANLAIDLLSNTFYNELDNPLEDVILIKNNVVSEELFLKQTSITCETYPKEIE